MNVIQLEKGFRHHEIIRRGIFYRKKTGTYLFFFDVALTPNLVTWSFPAKSYSPKS
jgi:hypothetical protein